MTSKPSSQKAVQEVTETAADVKAEVCKGQRPADVSAEVYNAWPDSAKVYATNNVSQWIKGGCS